MAHEVETMAYAGETPWHGLGFKVDETLSAEDMMKAAKLDWRVEKVPSFIEYNGKRTNTGQSALVRSSDGSILTNIGANWEPVQNDEAFGFFKDFVDGGKMTMETAGSLKDGKIVWALAKVNESFTLFNGKDRVESYLLFSNPHQYGKSMEIRFTPTRVVCWNTLSLSLSEKTDMQLTLSHRKIFNAELAKQTLGLAHNKLDDYKHLAEFLSKKKMTDERFLEFVAKLFPASEAKTAEKVLSRPAAQIVAAKSGQAGAEFGEGTWWQGLNAVTFATNHTLGKTADTRLRSAWYGAGRNKNIQAVNLAMEMANS